MVSEYGVYYTIGWGEDDGTHRHEIVELNLNTAQVRIIAELPAAGELGVLTDGNLIVSPGGYGSDEPLRLLDSASGETLKELFIGRDTNDIQALGDDLFAIYVDGSNEIVVFDGKAFTEVRRIPAPCEPFVLRMHYAER